jgi:type VI secretion system protein ImpL
LPASVRQEPVVFVVGDKLAGASDVVEAGLALGLQPAVVSSQDPRMKAYSGRGVRIVEISGEWLEDARPASRNALHALFRSLAPEVALVLCVVDTRATSWTPNALQRTGMLLRDAIDVLTAGRGDPPRVRVGLTSVDQSAEGFAEVAAVAREVGRSAMLFSSGRTGSELAASLAPLDGDLPTAIATLAPAELQRFTRFCSTTGPRLLSGLAPLLETLLARRATLAPQAIDGIVLVDASPGRPRAVLGDPLAIDTKEIQDAVERDFRALDRRRTLFTVVAISALVVPLLGTYQWHEREVAYAEDAVSRFAALATSAKPEDGSAEEALLTSEAAAAGALRAALTPLYPPLRIALPNRKARARDAFLETIRELYVFPAVRSDERAPRVYALSLLYAGREGELASQVRASPDRWAAGISAPPRVVDDYLRWTEQPWNGPVPEPPAAAGAVTLGDWRAWLEQLDSALRRPTIAQADLERLQKEGRALSESIGEATELRALDRVVKSLEQAAGAEVATRVGRGDVARVVPGWVTDNRDAIDTLLHLVARSKLAVPDASGKNLRAALDDLTSIANDGADQASTTVTLSLGGTHTYRTDAWTTLIRSSRAATYARAFRDDVAQSERSPFFAKSPDYAPVGAFGTGTRGPQKTLSGLYTAAAVNNEIKPALEALDRTLKAASLPDDERGTLTRLVLGELPRYASQYRAALSDYVASFRLEAPSLVGLRADLEDLVGADSFFTRFWATVAQNAAIDPAGDDKLQPLADAVASFQPIVQVMTGDQGKYPMLAQYDAIVGALLPSLDGGPPGLTVPAGAPLAQRLPPVGLLGLAALATDKPAPLVEVDAWLTGARLREASLRQPFLLPVERAYAYALQAIETTLDEGYRGELRPQVAPLLSAFPLDPCAAADVAPEVLGAVVGPKGSFRMGMDALLGPVCKTGSDGSCVPRAPTGYRAVRLPAGASALWAWAQHIGGNLWDDGGKPKPIVVNARARALPEFKQGATTVATLSFLRAGTTTAYGFNQTPAWQPLSVIWFDDASASLGLERTEPGNGEKTTLTVEGDGDAWQFYRLLRKGQAQAGATTWLVGAPITFEIAPEPWSLVAPPGASGLRCASDVARN